MGGTGSSGEHLGVGGEGAGGELLVVGGGSGHIRYVRHGGVLHVLVAQSLLCVGLPLLWGSVGYLLVDLVVTLVLVEGII